MTDQLVKIAQIIQSGAFEGHRIRLIGNTRTVAVEIRGLSADDMAGLADSNYKVAFDEPADLPDTSAAPNTSRMSFLDKIKADPK